VSPDIGTLWRRWVVYDGFVVEYVVPPDEHTYGVKTIIVMLEGHVDDPRFEDLLGQERVYNTDSFHGTFKPWIKGRRLSGFQEFLDS